MNIQHLRAKNLRNNSTLQEQKLWEILRKKNFSGLKFTRQYPIGKYIVDFACRRKKLVIEIDGGQHNQEYNILSDEERTKFIESQGYKIIRFWNNEIIENIEGVYQKLQDFCNED
ncbi:endonuclease domain-containing protein [bacterium]|nr:endonuclease domain-containing protein [bacterium]